MRARERLHWRWQRDRAAVARTIVGDARLLTIGEGGDGDACARAHGWEVARRRERGAARQAQRKARLAFGLGLRHIPANAPPHAELFPPQRSAKFKKPAGKVNSVARVRREGE